MSAHATPAGQADAATPAVPPSSATPADPQLAHVVNAWPELPEHVQATILTLIDAARDRVSGIGYRVSGNPKPDTRNPKRRPAAAFDRAFAELDRQSGGHNFVSLVALRQALALGRQDFDTLLHKLRQSGRYSLAAAEGRHGVTPAEQEAGIIEGGQLLLYVCRKKT